MPAKAKSRILSRLIAEIAVQLALWDIALCKCITELGSEILRDPIVQAQKLIENHREYKMEDSALYTAGYQDSFDGNIVIHSMVLITRNDQLTISRRIWKAELVILLPFIEEERIRTI
jgi:hypothetical protein